MQPLTFAEPRYPVLQAHAQVEQLTTFVAPQSTVSAGALAVALTVSQLESGPFKVMAATVDTSAVPANKRASSLRCQALKLRSRGSTVKRAAHVKSTSNYKPIALDLSGKAPLTTAALETVALVAVASALNVIS